MSAIAYLGPPGTFTSDALHQCSDLTEEIACASVQEVIDGVEDGRFESGIIPIENSVEGLVTAHLDRVVFHTKRVLIHSEHIVNITFDAFVHPDTPAGAAPAEIRSHPVALAQCGNWIAAQGGASVPTSSTAAACEEAAGQPGIIALASPAAGRTYGLRTYARGVGDNPGAQTRFWRIGRGLAACRVRPSTTTLVCLPENDRTGVLAEMLNVLALRGIGLTSLAVRPTKDTLGRYSFTLSLEGHIQDPPVRDAIEELLAQGCAVKLLGSYQSGAKTLRSVGGVSVIPGATHRRAAGTLLEAWGDAES